MKVANQFSKKFGSHWIKIKFYQQLPSDFSLTSEEPISFCRATRKALIKPVVISSDNLNCPGAKYVFGWHKNRDKIMQKCHSSSGMSLSLITKIFNKIDCFQQSIVAIGLNMSGVPDVLLSYLSPLQASLLIKAYEKSQAEKIEVAPSSLMSICGGLIAKSYYNQRLNLSFAGGYSRKCAKLSPDFLAAAVPSNLFDLLLN